MTCSEYNVRCASGYGNPQWHSGNITLAIRRMQLRMIFMMCLLCNTTGRLLCSYPQSYLPVIFLKMLTMTPSLKSLSMPSASRSLLSIAISAFQNLLPIFVDFEWVKPTHGNNPLWLIAWIVNRKLIWIKMLMNMQNHKTCSIYLNISNSLQTIKQISLRDQHALANDVTPATLLIKHIFSGKLQSLKHL